MVDDRKDPKLNADVKAAFEERRPEGVTQSEFVAELPDNQPIEVTRSPSLDEFGERTCRELDDFADRLIDRLRREP